MINKIVSYIMVICLFCAVPQVVFADETVITSPHAVLMEASTGKIIYEKEKDINRSLEWCRKAFRNSVNNKELQEEIEEKIEKLSKLA